MNRKPPGLLDGIGLQIGTLVPLLAVTAWAWDRFGRPHPWAFWIAVAVPVVHQVYVWLTWRLQLQSGVIGRALGFPLYAVLFFVLFFGRFVTIAWLGWLDRGSLGLPSIAHAVLTIVLTAIALFTGYSVGRFFGMARAAGADHFDPAYRDMPRVERGIFRFTSNGMYWGGFCGFWAIAVGCNSTAAVIVAAFGHAYIWVHFYATEKPDMQYLYGTGATGGG